MRSCVEPTRCRRPPRRGASPGSGSPSEERVAGPRGARPHLNIRTSGRGGLEVDAQRVGVVLPEDGLGRVARLVRDVDEGLEREVLALGVAEVEACAVRDRAPSSFPSSASTFPNGGPDRSPRPCSGVTMRSPAAQRRAASARPSAAPRPAPGRRRPEPPRSTAIRASLASSPFRLSPRRRSTARLVVSHRPWLSRQVWTRSSPALYRRLARLWPFLDRPASSTGLDRAGRSQTRRERDDQQSSAHSRLALSIGLAAADHGVRSPGRLRARRPLAGHARGSAGTAVAAIDARSPDTRAIAVPSISSLASDARDAASRAVPDRARRRRRSHAGHRLRLGRLRDRPPRRSRSAS